ncbi:MAG: glycoside hydrolase family 16 protein [Crocinitomicaceae bacterium]|nr:glycoside hydrolase family 16 protein [Crocinitomicaceae bacterium]MBK8924772.1 glycoside hydrolase family 16 protein [Crocinitomicaceae bacterium]
MMIRKKILFWLCFNALVSTAQTPPDLSDPTWEIWLEDDFNDNSLDLSKWYVYNQFDHFGANDVVFLDDNVSETGGNLVLTFKKENYTCTAPHNCVRQTQTGNSYTRTSGYIATKPDYDFKYGYIEARIKMSYDYGLHPAFWTWRGWTVVDGQNAAEIDIFEMNLGSQLGEHITTTNIHYEYNDPATPEDEHLPMPYVYEEVNIGNYNGVYRTFGLEWNPNQIIWYVDGLAIRTYAPHEVHDKVKLILDLAIEYGSEPNGTTPTTSEMYIDYVKIYQQNGQCNLAYNACDFDYYTYESTVKKGIVIGGPGCSSSLPVNANLYLNVVETVLINGEFTVPLGAVMTVQIEPDCYIISN